MTLRIAVLASGRGSNLHSLIQACAAGTLAIEFAGVFSDRDTAGALAVARAAGIHARSLSPREHLDRLAFDRALFAAIEAVQPQLIVCAGYMRIIDSALVERHLGQMINIHPSLLPAYQGLHTHQRVLNAGDRSHGASVHFVTPELDGGPVIAQVRIKVEPTDDARSLAQRLLGHEHRLLVTSVDLFVRRALSLTPQGVTIDGRALEAPLQLDPDHDLRTIDGERV